MLRICNRRETTAAATQFIVRNLVPAKIAKLKIKATLNIVEHRDTELELYTISKYSTNS